MGFADLSIQAIAEDYRCSIETVLSLCDHLGIRYKDADTRLALEDAKAIILAIQAKSTTPRTSTPT